MLPSVTRGDAIRTLSFAEVRSEDGSAGRTTTSQRI
jgi:hypothetical protein